MKTDEIKAIQRQIARLHQGKLAPSSAWKVERLPDRSIRRTALNVETVREANAAGHACDLANSPQTQTQLNQTDKPMKTLLCIFLIAAASAQRLHAQTIETIAFLNIGSGPDRQQDISVPTGQVFELLTWATSGGGSPSTLKVDGIDVSITTTSSLVNPPVFSPNFVIAGPHTVSVVVRSDHSLVCSYRLKVNGEVATANVATQVVVIPQNATAPADIILESSTDLITWTAALPGSYSPAGSNRFFRVRLVTH